MANELAGLFGAANVPLSGRDQLARALMGFGAGVQGNAAPTLEMFRQQDQALSLERQQAMAQDAMRVANLLGNGWAEDALKLIDNRIEQINKLGGDPSDTLGVRNLIASGRSKEALQEIDVFLAAAKQRGVLGKQNADEFGLTPVVLRGPSGEYIPAQLSKSGGIVPVQLPEGAQFVPDAARMGYDPNMIAQRGTAETGVQVDRTQQLAGPEAQAAGMVRAAQEAATINAIPEKVAAETAAERIAQQPQRAATQASEERKYGLVSDLLSKAANQANAWTTGLMGTSLSSIPGTSARDLRGTIDTIKANIGTSQLQEMRNNSPTGGALGQVTEFENKMLQALLGNLEQSQSPQQFRDNLDLVQRQLDQIVNGQRAQYENIYGQPPADAVPATAGKRVGRFIIEESPQ